MKICAACHRETFDGRSTCHRCGSDVSDRPALELPTTDAASLLTRLPSFAKSGTLHLDIDGLRFTNAADEELLSVPPHRIRRVTPRGAQEMWVEYENDRGGNSRARLRVRWAPRAQRYWGPQRNDSMIMMQAWRLLVVPMMGFGGGKRRLNLRDYEVVRDRWLWSINALLGGDRYVSGRRPSLTS